MFSTKNMLFCLSVTIGILAAILVFVAGILPASTPTWLKIGAAPGFVAWALYFAKGGGTDSMVKTITGNIVGALVGFLCLFFYTKMAISNATVGALVLALMVLVACFIFCLGAAIPLIEYIPAMFCGCACAFMLGAGTVPVLVQVILSMAIGAVLAYISDIWAKAMNKGKAS